MMPARQAVIPPDEEVRERRRNGGQDANHSSQEFYEKPEDHVGIENRQEPSREGSSATATGSDSQQEQHHHLHPHLHHPHLHTPKAIRRRVRHQSHWKRNWSKFMHSDAKNHLVAFLGEFIGTSMFLFFAFAGTETGNIGSNSDSTTGESTGFNPTTLIYIALSFGFSLMVNAWIFFRISGGLFNPAVTLSLALLGSLTPARAFILFIAQLTGACWGAWLTKVMFPVKFSVATTLGGSCTIAQGIFIEAFGTAELVFAILMLAKEKHEATPIAPVGIGLALFIGELVGVQYTGGSYNPVRSFAPDAITRNFQSNHWLYWVGPFIGTLMATFFYWLFKALEYEMANPGQDGDEKNDPTQNFDHPIAQNVDIRREEVMEIAVLEESGDVRNPLQNMTPSTVFAPISGILRSGTGSSSAVGKVLGVRRSRTTSLQTSDIEAGGRRRSADWASADGRRRSGDWGGPARRSRDLDSQYTGPRRSGLSLASAPTHEVMGRTGKAENPVVPEEPVKLEEADKRDGAATAHQNS